MFVIRQNCFNKGPFISQRVMLIKSIKNIYVDDKLKYKTFLNDIPYIYLN